MKNLKFLFLLSFAMFLTIGSVQAQAKKSCKMPCTKAKTAQVETTATSTTPIILVSQERASESKVTKNCDPKNCDPKNCDIKNCPAGCDMSQCAKGAKTSATGMKVTSSTKTSCCKARKAADKVSASPSKMALK